MLELELMSKPSDSVREIETPDGSALLDIRRGLCLSMTPVGVMIWHQLKLNHSQDQIACSLATEFQDVPREQIQGDVDQFVEDLKRHALLVSGRGSGHEEHLPKFLKLLEGWRSDFEDGPELRARSHRFLFWKALFGLFAYDLFRFGKNFTRVHRYIRNWPVARHIVPCDSADRACKAINHACVWYPKRVLCLQRSAVTTWLLRNCGVHAEMVIGAQTVPFRAHAWTEVDGRAINERRDVQRAYLVWERC